MPSRSCSVAIDVPKILLHAAVQRMIRRLHTIAVRPAAMQAKRHRPKAHRCRPELIMQICMSLFNEGQRGQHGM
jgi:hypothetical protein